MEKTLTFWHFLVGGGHIRYWLEMTSFLVCNGFVSYEYHWWMMGTLCKCKKVNDVSAKRSNPCSEDVVRSRC